MIVLGFDPGGIKSFGWAVLQIDAAGAVIDLKTGVTSTAPDAIQEAAQSAASAPMGIGIDAPLFWVQQGYRRADAHIRKRVVAAGGRSGTVSAVNSLRGACLAQGILVAWLAAGLWPNALVTEAHPKALRQLDADARRFVDEQGMLANEHPRDAALAAFAAWAATTFHPGWRNLLADDRARSFQVARKCHIGFLGDRRRVEC
jgi:predicted nuclease with RNAse H fold